jgi:phage/plasmid-like protein (TIGR03299 family)
MAHNLSIRSDGKVEMAYRGTTPWHGLGTAVADYMTAQEALQAAGLDWNVIKRPIAHLEADGSYKAFPGFNALLRDDTMAILTVAKASYEPLQNRAALAFSDEIVGSGAAKYETAGALDGGRKIWMLAELSKCNISVAGDEIKPYFLLHNSHDGTSKVRGILTPTRVVCWNTLSSAMAGARTGEGFELRHTKNITDHAQAAREALGLILNNYDELGKKFNMLAAKSFTDVQLAGYVEEMLPSPMTGGDRSLENARDRRKIAVRLTHEGKGNDRTGVRGTWWAAYNGMTELLDHVGGWRTPENRMKDVIFGQKASMKSQALSLALSCATGKTEYAAASNS